MPSLSMITTTAGRAAILGAVAGSSSLVVDDAQLSNVDQSVGIGTTSLTNIVATLAATGSVRVAGSGHALHVVLADDSTAVYDVRTIALRLDDGTFLMVYSQAGIIATKAAGSSLHLAFDLTIDADTAATLDFGDTDYALPAASESSAGVVELATAAEVDSGTDITRVLTPYQFERRASYLLGALGILNRVVRTAAGAYSGTFNGVCYASDLGLFVAVGVNGEIQTSPDGETWTQRTAGGAYTGTFTSVCSNGAGLLVAVGTGGEIQTSPDGTTWTHRTAGSGYVSQFNDVCFGGGLFVAVGASAEIQTSPDGTTWTHRTAGSGYAFDLFGVAYHSTLFVATGYTGEIQTSPDGTTWTHRTSGTAELLAGVSSGAGIVVAVGADTTVCYSDDGITWSTYDDAALADIGTAITYGRGLFAVASYIACWAIDASGISRRSLGRPDRGASMEGVAFGKDSFVFVGANGAIEQAFV